MEAESHYQLLLRHSSCWWCQTGHLPKASPGNLLLHNASTARHAAPLVHTADIPSGAAASLLLVDNARHVCVSLVGEAHAAVGAATEPHTPRPAIAGLRIQLPQGT